MIKIFVRVLGNVAIVVGLFLLVRVFYDAAAGTLVARIFPQSHSVWSKNVTALVLALPIPFHVISVGLVLQRRWFSPRWARVAWLATVISGCWLGVALGVKLLIL